MGTLNSEVIGSPCELPEDDVWLAIPRETQESRSNRWNLKGATYRSTLYDRRYISQKAII
jgi:hypothetical protein